MTNITTESEYDVQAREFMESTGLEIEFAYQGHRPYFPGDEEQRAVWNVTFKRKGRKDYTFTFGASIVDSYTAKDMRERTIIGKSISLSELYRIKGYKDALRNGGGSFQAFVMSRAKVEPSAYDVLACMDACAPESFSEFCAEFGGNEDSIRERDTFLAVCEQASSLRRMFDSSELERLAEIA